MWSHKKPDLKRPVATVDITTARLGPRLHVKGDISGTEDLRIGMHADNESARFAV
jgi:hypothetical protein